MEEATGGSTDNVLNSIQDNEDNEVEESKETFDATVAVEVIQESPDGTKDSEEESSFDRESPKEGHIEKSSRENESSDDLQLSNSREGESNFVEESLAIDTVSEYRDTEAEAAEANAQKESVEFTSEEHHVISFSSPELKGTNYTKIQPENFSTARSDSLESSIQSLTTTTQQLVPIEPPENHSAEWKRYFRLPLKRCSSFIPTPYTVQNHLKGSFNFLGNHGVGAWKTGTVSTDVILNNLTR